MNLSQIERKFQCVDFMANYINYKYNPHIPKIKDLKQHVYKDLLYADSKQDRAMYGLAAFQEGDPQEIVIGSQKMSSLGGKTSSKQVSNQQRPSASGSTSQANITRTNTSQRNTPMKQRRSGRGPQNYGQGTIVTDGSYRQATEIVHTVGPNDDVHTKSQVMFNGGNMLAPSAMAHTQQRPYTSKVPQSRSGMIHSEPNTLRGARENRSNSTQSRWALTRPLRQGKQQKSQFQASKSNKSHIIKRSKLDVSQLPSADKVSTSLALGRYHASKLNNLLHMPRQTIEPTVFYKVGENIRTETQMIFDGSPQRPKHFVVNGNIIYQANQGDLVQGTDAARLKEEEYGNLMKQLYKIKIPDQILHIIRGANHHLNAPQLPASSHSESLMQLMNTQYLQALATEPSKKALSVSTTQKLSLTEFGNQMQKQDQSTLQGQLHGRDSALSRDLLSLHKKSTFAVDPENNRVVTADLPFNEYQNLQQQFASPTNQDKLQLALQGTVSVPELTEQKSMDYEHDKKADQALVTSVNDQNQVHTLFGQTSVQNSTTSQLQVAKNQTELTTGSVLTPIDDCKYRAAGDNKTSNEYSLPRTGQANQNKDASMTRLNPLYIREDKNEAAKDSSSSIQQHTIVVHQNNASAGNMKSADQQQTLTNDNTDQHHTTNHSPENLTEKDSPTFSAAHKAQQELNNQQLAQAQRDGKLLFNLKITDLTTADNPFVFYQNQQVDDEGYLLFQSNTNPITGSGGTPDVHGKSSKQRKPLPKASVFKSYNNLQQFGNSKNSIQQLEHEIEDQFNYGATAGPSYLPNAVKNGLNATIMLPWLQKPSDLEKRTLKIEVTFKGELILLRIIHIDKLYPTQYPMIALKIANNMIQNNLLMTNKITIDESEPTDRAVKQFIKVERNLNKKLTKASSVATYDTHGTNHTQQIMMASGGLELAKNISNSGTKCIDIGDQIEVKQNDSPRNQPLERSQVVMKTRSNNNKSIKIINNSPENINSDSNSVIVRTNMASTSDQQMQGIKEPTLLMQREMDPVQDTASLDQKQSKSGKQQVLAIKRVNVSSAHGSRDANMLCYYKITPQPNEILGIIEKLQNFELNVMDVADSIRESRLLRFPEIMKNLQLIIEFSDCIIQGKDLLNYDIVIDEDEERMAKTSEQVLAQQLGLPNAGKVQGVQVSPAKVPQKDGIIKENLKEASGPGQMSSARKKNIKNYIKNNSANYFVLRNTNHTLNRIKDAQRQQTPLCAQQIRNKKEQFHYLQNSMALKTSAMPIQDKSTLQPNQLASKVAKDQNRNSISNQQWHLQKRININQTLNQVDDHQDLTLKRFNSGSFKSGRQEERSPSANAISLKQTRDRTHPTNFMRSNFTKETENLVSSGLTSTKNQPQSADQLSNPLQNRYQHLNSNQIDISRNDEKQKFSGAHEQDGGTLPIGKNTFFKQSDTAAQSLNNLIKEDSDMSKVPQAVYCKDQIVVTQANKDVRKRTSEFIQKDHEFDKNLDLFAKQSSNQGLFRQGTTNSDLDILKDPSIRPQVIKPMKVQNAAAGLNSALELQESQLKGDITSALRHSDDFQRSSLLKKNLINATVNGEAHDYMVHSDGVKNYDKSSTQAYDIKPFGAPIGPIAYLSKYQGHMSSFPVSSSLQVSLMQKKHDGLSTTYGLAQNRQVTPLVQPQADATALNQSWGSATNQDDSKLQKMPHQSVLQHQAYGSEPQTISQLTMKGYPANAATFGPHKFNDSQQTTSIQMLAPVQNYLYRGSNARKTVRELLDAKQVSDAAMLYEAITNKKFDVPSTRQDFSKPLAYHRQPY